LTDTPEESEHIIKEHAFSAGEETKKLQEELGADVEVLDIAYQWLRLFLEEDEELDKIRND
jgi:tryptophanyl-tRNA synthetase